MNIDEGRILALTGAMLADGTFEFEGEEAASLPSPPNAMVMVREFDGLDKVEIALVGNVRRDADGFYSADWQSHAVTLQANMPSLHGMLEYRSFPADTHLARLHFDAEKGGLAWCAFDMNYKVQPSRTIRGFASHIDVKIERLPDGVRFHIDVLADQLERDEGPVSPLKLRIAFTLTFSTIALAGSRLSLGRHGAIWNAHGDGVEPGPLGRALKLDYFGGRPFFDGRLDLGPALPDFYRGNMVAANFFGCEYSQSILWPQRNPTRMPSGFYNGDSGRPQLVLNHFGPARWKDMLGDGDEAELIQRGSGIGYSQRVTGPSTQDEGPHIQLITMMRTRLMRTEEGLAVSVLGELGPYDSQKPAYEPLGPEFSLEFFVPTAFFFARGMTFGKMWQERKQRLEGVPAQG